MQHPGSLPPQDSKLRYLAVVNVCDIPLYLAAGPALDVWSNEDRTEEAFSQFLLTIDEDHEGLDRSAEPWWLRPCQQSDLGVLVSVEGGDSNETRSLARQVTEFLLYATVSEAAQVDGLLTPPRSSSPAPEGLAPQIDQDLSQIRLRLHALPLCRTDLSALTSDDKVEATGNPPSPGKAYSLPLKRSVAGSTDRTTSSKRRKISNVFDDATTQRRKLKGRGGEAISKAMAEPSLASGPHGPQPNRSVSSAAEQPRERQISSASNENPQATDLRRRSLSRVSSTETLLSHEPSRPPSRHDSFMPNRRSGLNRVKSVLASDNGIQQQNTSSLSRIVMAGMRMYGLQQKKKALGEQRQNSKGDTGRPEPGVSQGDPDEYKLVYHQTFKGACFAFRNHFTTHHITQDSMREVVDRLLLLYCTDPLSKASVDSPGDEMFGSQEDKSHAAFDMPSISALNAVAATPPLRRSKHGDPDDRSHSA